MELKPDKDLTIQYGRERRDKRLEKDGAKRAIDRQEDLEKEESERRLSITPDQLEGIKKYGYAEDAEVNGHQLTVMVEPGTGQYYIYAGERVELNNDPDLAREVFKYAKALAKIEKNPDVLNEKIEDFAIERMNADK